VLIKFLFQSTHLHSLNKTLQVAKHFSFLICKQKTWKGIIKKRCKKIKTTFRKIHAYYFSLLRKFIIEKNHVKLKRSFNKKELQLALPLYFSLPFNNLLHNRHEWIIITLKFASNTFIFTMKTLHKQDTILEFASIRCGFFVQKLLYIPSEWCPTLQKKQAFFQLFY